MKLVVIRNGNTQYCQVITESEHDKVPMYINPTCLNPQMKKTTKPKKK